MKLLSATIRIGQLLLQPIDQLVFQIASLLISCMSKLSCRDGCGACCIAPSISSSIPGMPDGKPAGVRCVQLDAMNRCMIFGKPERPTVCESLQPSSEMCGASREHAMHYLARLDALTSS